MLEKQNLCALLTKRLYKCIIELYNILLIFLRGLYNMNDLDILIERYPELESQRENILKAFEILKTCFSNGGKLLVAGNGGSASDSEHIVGELMKGFENARHLSPKLQSKLKQIDSEMGTVLAENLQGALPAIALDGHPSLSSAYLNDCEPLLGFAQQVNGYGNKNDVFLGISTSGNSKNILYASVTAKALGMKVIGLTGAKDSNLSELADVTVRSSQTRTYMIQEHHLPIYHCICLMLEKEFYGE